jgi:hypothetical protein
MPPRCSRSAHHQCAACNVPRATCRVQRAACNVPRCNVPHATCNVPQGNNAVQWPADVGQSVPLQMRGCSWAWHRGYSQYSQSLPICFASSQEYAGADQAAEARRADRWRRLIVPGQAGQVRIPHRTVSHAAGYPTRDGIPRDMVSRPASYLALHGISQARTSFLRRMVPHRFISFLHQRLCFVEPGKLVPESDAGRV